MSNLFYTNYSKKELGLSLTVMVLIIIIFYYFMPSNNELLCNDLKSMKAQKVMGTVKRVYIDREEHNNEIVEYSAENSEQFKMLVLSLDSSGLFQTLKPGDYIRKDKGSLLVHINKDTTIQIDYGVSYAQCNKK